MTLNDWFVLWLVFTTIITVLYIAEHIRFWYFEYPKFNSLLLGDSVKEVKKK